MHVNTSPSLFDTPHRLAPWQQQHCVHLCNGIWSDTGTPGPGRSTGAAPGKHPAGQRLWCVARAAVARALAAICPAPTPHPATCGGEGGLKTHSLHSAVTTDQQCNMHASGQRPEPCLCRQKQQQVASPGCGCLAGTKQRRLHARMLAAAHHASAAQRRCLRQRNGQKTRLAADEWDPGR